MDDDYTGSEDSLPLPGSTSDAGTVPFWIVPEGVGGRATPLFDEEAKQVVGFQIEPVTGVYKVYDLEGNFVTIWEKGLESPLIDPIDIIFIVGGLARLGFRALEKVALSRVSQRAAPLGAIGVQAAKVTISTAALNSLRIAFRRVSSGGTLNFTKKTIEHMGNPGRFVPVHILRLAIRFGKRGPDPQGAAGAFRYTIEMFRNGQRYTLEVVLRESDQTILHFLYK